ncbi:response regulator transcription factor [Rubrivirga sp.]|uniref:response regulator transcription factor n=1 Tax=Rubrivirga sp. TaxID=1885344 RepID=UPI003C73F745
MTHRIFLVEDHPITREGLRALLAPEKDLAIVGEADTAPDALSRIGECEPHLALVDIAIGGSDGVELTKQLRALYPDLKILAVSAYSESVYAERIVRAGANGYVAKQEAASTLLDAVRAVLEGRLHLSESVRERVVGSYLSSNSASEPSVADLTDRELEVFRHFGHGLTTAEVADAMMLSPKTVETHRVHIKQKLGLKTTNEFIQRAALWTAQNEV